MAILGVIAAITFSISVATKNHPHPNYFMKWKHFKQEFGKAYNGNDEEQKRYEIFKSNVDIIYDVNSQNLSYTLGVNQFADLTSDEFAAQYLGLKQPKQKWGDLPYLGRHEYSGKPLKASVDWTTKGVVTPVKNQGQCGSCWSFSATGAIECQYAIKTGTLVSLSEQQLVDCAGARYGCAGCNGGQMTGAMEYAAKEGGLCSEEEYKYTARDGTCKADSCGTKYDANKGVNTVTKYSSSALEAATAEGCVSIGIEADQTAFQHYSSGVLTGTCGTQIDHGVLIVGYGEEGGQKFWKVKNSWGETWGEKGYINICRDCDKNGSDGECGILMEPAVPTF